MSIGLGATGWIFIYGYYINFFRGGIFSPLAESRVAVIGAKRLQYFYFYNLKTLKSFAIINITGLAPRIGVPIFQSLAKFSIFFPIPNFFKSIFCNAPD